MGNVGRFSLIVSTYVEKIKTKVHGVGSTAELFSSCSLKLKKTFALWSRSLLKFKLMFQG